MTSSTNIDELVKRLHQKKEEYSILGKEIENSAKEVCVLFVDLSDSTSMKNRRVSR
ncbi:MAG: hypothetical protein K9N21_17400 [Deltaproteobacteria bacterium]|nr:hypothetical protein [Deltaproteobacteria bacterium]